MSVEYAEKVYNRYSSFSDLLYGLKFFDIGRARAPEILDLSPGTQLLEVGVGTGLSVPLLRTHGFVHVRTIGEPVTVFGLRVHQGDLVHADRHGAVVIPKDVLPRLPGAIDTLLRSEQLILGPAREPDFDIEKLETAWAAFEKART